MLALEILSLCNNIINKVSVTRQPSSINYRNKDIRELLARQSNYVPPVLKEELGTRVHTMHRTGAVDFFPVHGHLAVQR